jgi:hypothetical protein
VPASNFDLHHAHCIRNLERCTVCGDMIPKSRATEHHQDTHAPVRSFAFLESRYATFILM